MNYAIGIDIGGTKVAFGLVDQTGTVTARSSIHTDPDAPPAEMITRIAEAVKAMLAEQGITDERLIGIGIGAPGPLDPAAGKLTCPPNLPKWWDYPVVSEFGKHFALPIRMENDATAATLAEKWIGAAKHANHFIFVTISTGIGAGIYMHGKLLTGASGNAGDVGHMVIDPNAGTCKCGQRGCWEWIASGTAVGRMASERFGRTIASKEVFELAASGNAEMREITDRVFTYIGMGCVSLINALDPEMIVIGGGVSQVGAPMFDAVRSYVENHALNPSGRRTPLVPAALLQDAGLIGAAALIHVPY